MSELEPLSLQDARWSSFLAARPDASALHHPAWAQLLAETYGFRGFALATLGPGGRVSAGMPVLEVGWPRRRRWISLPFTDSCPPLLEEGSGAEFVEALSWAAKGRGLRQIEIRGELTANGACPRPVAVSHQLALQHDPDAVFRRFHKSQVQRAIRRAERGDLAVRRAERVEDVASVFYELHLQTRRRLGVPVQPRRFFRLLWERVLAPGLGYVLIVEVDGVPAAAAVFLEWKDVTIYKYGASDTRFWPARPNHAIFWHAIKTSCAAGKKTFDFGRSDFGDEGLRQFKSAWGAEERPLVYTTIGGGPPTDTLGTPARAARGMIRHAPLWVCELLGTRLYRYAA